MKRPLSRRDVLLGLSGIAVAPGLRPEKPMILAANTFLASLTPDQKLKAQLPFPSEERLHWHYIPMERQGLTYKAMSDSQQTAARALLKIGLSQKGLAKIETIRTLENVLKEIEKGSGPVRDPDLYYFTIFGEPSSTGVWGWRYEGHHVSLHWTVIKGKVIASTPQFMGANPAEVRSGAMKGTRVLAAEEDLARALLMALTPEQRTTAVISETAPGDILTAAQRKAAIQEDKGLAYRDLTSDQKGMMLTLIREHAGAQTPEIARQRLDAIRKAGLDGVKFAWMGGLKRGEPHYYRIQGKTFLVEYDNTQNNANHVHLVWRDFNGDFGLDLLEQHYRNSNHAHDDH